MRKPLAAAGWAVRWLGLSGAVLILAIWVSTWFREPWICDHDSCYVSAVAGQFFICDGKLSFDLAAHDRDNDYYQKPRTRRFLAGYDDPNPSMPQSMWTKMHVGRWWPEAIDVGPGPTTRYYIFIPIWMPLAAFAVPSGLAWLKRSRRPRPGECPRCRYVRAGLPADAVCPECGASPPRASAGKKEKPAANAAGC